MPEFAIEYKKISIRNIIIDALWRFEDQSMVLSFLVYSYSKFYERETILASYICA
jgi:hypothetical protein